MGDILNVLRRQRIQQQIEERRRRMLNLQNFRRQAAVMRRLRDNSNPFELPEAVFRGKYRLSRDCVRDLVEELRPYLPVPQRATAVHVELKVLTTLHFLGHGSYQKSIAADNNSPLSQTSVSVAIREVVDAMNNPAVLSAHVRFPEDGAERRAIIQRNFRRSSIPGVVGYIDGFHVLIIAPDDRQEQYRNRKGQTSINAQITVTSDMVVLNINARYPGSSHDSFIWGQCALRDKMEELYRGGDHCWLLGDSGYPEEPWLHIPISNAPPQSPEANYTKAHMIDRSVVERTIGHIRSRFRSVNKHRVLEYRPVKAGKIINSCAILHNICVERGVPLPSDSESDSEDEEDYPNPANIGGAMRDRLLNEARLVRNRIIARIPPLPPRAPFNPRRRHRRQQQ